MAYGMMILDDQNIMIREILAMANEMSRLWLQLFSNQKLLDGNTI